MPNWKEWKDNALLNELIAFNSDKDVAALALKWSAKKDLPVVWLLQQIAGRQSAQHKLPDWFNNKHIVYPPKITLEQCSSALTANYKASLVKSAKRIADLTGGLGVDTLAFSRLADEVLYIEPDGERLEIAMYNHKLLDAENIIYYNAKAEDALDKLQAFKPDMVYIDPSRRNDMQKRFYGFEELQPAVIPLLPQLFAITDHVLIKAAPMLDISQGVKELKNVSEVFVISTRNECKEILFRLQKNNITSPLIHCIELNDHFTSAFSFRMEEEQQLEVETSEVKKYIYDPFAAVAKAGGFKSLANTFNMKQLHSNTHLYTSDSPNDNFPGKRFKVNQIMNYDNGALKQKYAGENAHLVFRNFPVDAAEVINKLKIKSGADTYLFFVTVYPRELRVIECTKEFSSAD